MRSFIAMTFVIATEVVSSPAVAMPPWATDGQKRIGNTLSVVCNGEGISLELARGEALRGCKSTAASQVIDSVRVKNVSVETDESSAFHSEVIQNANVHGLTCIPKNEAIEEGDGSYMVWVRCEFDLSKASYDNVPDAEPIESKSGSVIKGGSDQTKAGSHFKTGRYETDKQTRLDVSTVPPCESIIVRGTKSRSFKCSRNPETVILVPGDSEIILRAKGHQPKTIQLQNPGESSGEAITVIFD